MSIVVRPAGSPHDGAVAYGGRRSIWDSLRDNPEWRRLWLARASSLLGNWLNTLAIVHLLGEGDATEALALAAVFILKQMPVALLGPAAGVVADRYDRRRIMVACDLLSCLAVALFFFAEPGGTRALIYALTLLQIAVTTFFDPAYRAVLPDLVHERDLVAANALGAVTWSIMFAAGTAIGGAILYFFGWRTAFALDAASYLVSAWLIAGIRSPATTPPRRPRPAGWAAALGYDEMVEGLRYILREPPVRRIIVVKFIWGTMGAVTLLLTVLGTTPAHRLAGSGDLGVSFLWFTRAAGTAVGPFVARWWSNDRPARLRQSVAMGFFVALACYAMVSETTTWWLAGVWVVLAHVGGSMVWVMSTVLLQQTVPTELRGRTFAAELGLVMLSSSIAHAVYGAVLDYTALDVRQTFVVAVCVCLVPAAAWSAKVGLRHE